MENPHLVCLQETKWEDANMRFINETLGGKYKNYVVLPVRQTAREGLYLHEMKTS